MTRSVSFCSKLFFKTVIKLKILSYFCWQLIILRCVGPVFVALWTGPTLYFTYTLRISQCHIRHQWVSEITYTHSQTTCISASPFITTYFITKQHISWRICSETQRRDMASTVRWQRLRNSRNLHKIDQKFAATWELCSRNTSIGFAADQCFIRLG